MEGEQQTSDRTYVRGLLRLAWTSGLCDPCSRSETLDGGWWKARQRGQPPNRPYLPAQPLLHPLFASCWVARLRRALHPRSVAFVFCFVAWMLVFGAIFVPRC